VAIDTKIITIVPVFSCHNRPTAMSAVAVGLLWHENTFFGVYTKKHKKSYEMYDFL
jgi:hypothetical protein